MNSYEMGEDYLKRAGRCLKKAEDALGDGDHPMAIGRSQECIELSIKAVLRTVAIEFPREHNVSEVLLNTEWGRIGSPIWFTEQVEVMAKIMREITPKRGPALYGFEMEMKPAHAIFSLGDGIKATTDARFVFETCMKFIQEWKR